MPITHIYDVECYPNCFMLGIIPLDANQKYVDGYIKADIANDKVAKKLFLQVMNVRTFTIFKSYAKNDKTVKDDRRLLADYFEYHKILYGFNSNGYDSIMIDNLLHHMKFYNNDGFNKDGIHLTQFLYEVSSSVIKFGKTIRYSMEFYRYYKRRYENRDIQAILYLDKSFTGLKKVGINLRWYRIQELPIDPHTYLTTSQVEQIADYNVNDILMTRALVIDQKAELEIRDIGSTEFGLDLTNKSRSSIGKSLFIKYYHDITGIPVKEFYDLRTNRYTIKVKDILDSKIYFKTPQFIKLFENVKKSIIKISSDTKKDDWIFALLYNGTKYIMAKGGLHSKDNPKIYDITKDNNMIMRDGDVTSFYPKIILNLKISPTHLLDYAFLTIMKFIMISRIKAKNDSKVEKDSAKKDTLTKKADIFKIVINRIYGAFKDIYDPLYDPKCTYETTVNGQLYLLMLIERLELAGIHIISANTDGIVALFDKSMEETYNTICKEWEKELDFELEFTDYERYVRYNVNAYIAIKKGFYSDYALQTIGIKDVDSIRKTLEKKYIKYKGLFIANPDFAKGFINPVVSIALNNHYIYGESVLEAMKTHATKKDGAYDFTITQKVDKKFDVQYHHIEFGELVKDTLQQYNRFYVSNLNTGNILKFNPDTQRYTSIVAKRNLQLLNFYDGHTIDDFNYSYYGQECLKIMNGVKKKDGISTLTLDFDFDDEINDDPEIEDIYEDYTYLYKYDD